MEVLLEADSRPEADAALMQPTARLAKNSAAAALEAARPHVSLGADISRPSIPEADIELAEDGAAYLAEQLRFGAADSAAALHATAEQEQRHADGSWQPSVHLADVPAPEDAPQTSEASVQPAEALPVRVPLTPAEHAPPGAEANAEAAEPCHERLVALAKHAMPDPASSIASKLVEEQSAASADEQALQHAQTGSQAAKQLLERFTGASAKQAEPGCSRECAAAPAWLELTGEAGQLEREPAGAADPAAAAAQLDTGSGAAEAARSAAEQPHLSANAAERDAEEPGELPAHAGGSAADSTLQEEGEGGRTGPAPLRSGSGAAPQVAGKEGAWRLAQRFKPLDDAEEQRGSEPGQGLIAAACPAGVQSNGRAALARAMPDPCGAVEPQAQAPETATGAPACDSAPGDQLGLLPTACIHGMEPGVHGGSGLPYGTALPGSATPTGPWMEDSQVVSLLLEPALQPDVPWPLAASSSPPPSPIPLPSAQVTRPPPPPPPPPLLPVLLASTARRSSALALHGRGGAAEAQRRARSATVTAAQGVPASADGRGPCPSPRARALAASRLSASAGYAALGAHAPDAAAAASEMQSPSLERVPSEDAAAADSQPDQAPACVGAALGESMHAVLGCLLAEPGGAPNRGTDLGPGPEEPELALRPLPRFRPLHWARVPCVAGSVWERLPAGSATLSPAAAHALSELFATRRPGEQACSLHARRRSDHLK